MSGSLSPPDNPHFNKQKNRPSKAGSSVNGPGQTRTADLTLIRGALYQLSYKPDSKFPTELGRHRSRSPASVQSFRPASDALPRRTEKIGKFAGKPAIVWHALVSDRPAHRRAPRRPGFGSIAKGAHMRSSFSHRVHSALVLALLAGTTAHAQLAEPLAGRLEAQVFNPATNTWGNTLTVAPASRIEFRFIVSYTGPNFDDLASWHNGGNQGNGIPNSMLSAAEGESGAPLASYGRVLYGATTAASASQNTITTWRHGGDFPRPFTPPGSWLRVAGISENIWPQWPQPGDFPVGSFGTRGVLANQQAAVNPVTGVVNTWHVAGTQNLVVFRGALLLSTDTDRTGNITIDIPQESLQPSGSGTPDGTPPFRFMTWQINQFGSTLQSGVLIEPATIIIPTPATLGLAAAALGITLRGRR